MNDNYSKALGSYTNFFNEHPNAVNDVTVDASECKLLEERVRKPEDKTICKHVCECGTEDCFRIFAKGYAVVAQCSLCKNEKIIYES